MVRVGGDFACFTRPEFKVERVSYDTMTPSAARGLLEAIFWRPEFRYEIREIRVLRPIHRMAILRNEISRRQYKEPIKVEGKVRQQRTSLILRDVEYVICADMVLRQRTRDPIAKYTAQFNRRIERGQCFQRPYFGTREFAAWFEPPNEQEVPIQDTRELGMMLFDFVYAADNGRKEHQFMTHDAAGAKVAWGYVEALFFHAKLTHGVLEVPYRKYRELYERERDNA